MSRGDRPIYTAVLMPRTVAESLAALPALEALAAGGRRLALVAPPKLAPLLALFPGEETLAAGSSLEETIHLLERLEPEEALVLESGLGAAWTVYRAGVPWRWGYGGGLRSLLLRPAVPRPRGRVHRSRAAARLLAALGVEEPESWVPRLPVSGELRAVGAERLARARLDGDDGPLVGLGLTADGGRAGRWPWKRFAALARELRRQVGGLRLAVLCGTEDLWPAVRLFEETGHVHPVIGPDLELPGLAGVLTHFDLVVAADGPVLHLAAAAGRPTLGLFGPTDPRIRGPAGEVHGALRGRGRRASGIAVEEAVATALARLSVEGEES